MGIKDKEMSRLVRTLTKLTGENPTLAVNIAVKERLQRIRLERRPNLAQRLVAIVEDCATRLKEPYRSAEHADILYPKLD